ncbi:MAG: hypothetical protein RLW62_24555 [Gammaproteobacteria bacterium]
MKHTGDGDGNAQTTVYARNARDGGRGRRCEPGWHPAIADLVRRDYAFLPLTYAGDGVLFRGLASGLGTALAGGQCTPSAGTHALNALERETGVVFVSQDVGDALAVARLWEGPADGGILVIPAGAFARAHAAGNAAVLGFADPGVVFRYPCFAPPLALAALAAVIVHPAAAPRVHASGPHRVLVLPAATPPARGEVGAAVTRLLADADLHAAHAVSGARHPRRA